jgi:SAM-dependent methyltransferase
MADTTATFDAAAAQRLDQLYSTGDVVVQRVRTREALAVQTGEHILDVGCGPGFLVCELAGDVGPAGHVTGVDTSEAMLSVARDRAGDLGLAARTSFLEGDAVALPTDDGAMRRVLRSGGRLAILDTDWRSCVWHASDRERTARILRAWEGHFAHPQLPVHLSRLLPEAGFEQPSVRIVPIVNAALSADTYSAGMLEQIARWTSRRGGVDPDDAEAWRADVRAQADRGTYFFSLCRYLFTTRAR